MTHNMQDSNTKPTDTSAILEILIPIAKAILGVIMLCVGFANIYNLVEWAHDNNQILVYFGFFLWMSISGMLFWSGVKGIIKKVKEASR